MPNISISTEIVVSFKHIHKLSYYAFCVFKLLIHVCLDAFEIFCVLHLKINLSLRMIDQLPTIIFYFPSSSLWDKTEINVCLNSDL